MNKNSFHIFCLLANILLTLPLIKHDFYKYLRDEDCQWFEFESVSVHKSVKKVVVITPFHDNPDIFNLALADAFPDGSYSDKSVTNNDDMEKVMATVIRTVLRFFERHPTKLVYIEGSTAERTRLYRIVISREISEIEKTFAVFGLLNDNMEIFKKNQNYEAFVIALNNEENLLKLLYENDNQ